MRANNESLSAQENLTLVNFLTYLTFFEKRKKNKTETFVPTFSQKNILLFFDCHPNLTQIIKPPYILA